ncbi:MAG: hypothetical protein CO150_00935 [Nitrospirae bacterium CG_4_9_14_3_um_filter_53_35]|nr:MAG: hypothetical protein AUK29_04105 [Nitrospirae bacterium CG2_30_53_67]PIS37736.1 MAG: hypothetical protein COT35_04470 [Nitrospirae bacterium CG08_land_8_20_14_0_20_52_24]PIV84669.1 MAG: hypothetical protein COW52_06385 [Nitrospirae bacterium CG17_big_fil_post_rev_8_21_14_2_50_50_9]PIW85471.1 MAG: hypothetical protein COZ95_04305 [Nitrospirae bacterium CG_4_8_14_3_um_filter_50_41]PIX85717.1 MAG: hypothetical protein COZ32_07025 [Nitrospirae bacterium CG_4_10_14_3_um_filter_53_41]PJA7743
MKITDHNKAKRLARTILSDIALYNKSKIEKGIKNDNLFDLLKEDLDKGLELYRSRVAPEITDHTNYYNHAVVDILVRKGGNIESDIW